MATVRHLEHAPLDIESPHLDVDATYAIVRDSRDNKRCLQIDTYGSAERKIPGKKSQSMRFTEEAIAELRQLLDRHFPAARS